RREGGPSPCDCYRAAWLRRRAPQVVDPITSRNFCRDVGAATNLQSLTTIQERPESSGITECLVLIGLDRTGIQAFCTVQKGRCLMTSTAHQQSALPRGV